MKVERLNENQIKFTLTPVDLIERNLQISELTYGSEKTRALFREMMATASAEYGFHPGDYSLTIEAMPSAIDSISVVVTRVKNQEKSSSVLSFTKSPHKNKTTNKNLNNNEEDDSLRIYSFKTLDDVINLSKSIINKFTGYASLIKDNELYYLVITYHPLIGSSITIKDIEKILNEYGDKHISTELSLSYLLEHGEIIVENHAVRHLSCI